METPEDFYRRTGISKAPNEGFAFVWIEPCGHVSGMLLDQREFDLTLPPTGVLGAREILDVIRRGGHIAYLTCEVANKLPRSGPSSGCTCTTCRMGGGMPPFGVGDELVVAK